MTERSPVRSSAAAAAECFSPGSAFRADAYSSGCPAIHLGVQLFIWVSSYSSGCPVIHLGVQLFIWVSSYSSGCPVIHLGVQLFIWLSSYSSGCPVIHLAVQLFIWLSRSPPPTTHHPGMLKTPAIPPGRWKQL